MYLVVKTHQIDKKKYVHGYFFRHSRVAKEDTAETVVLPQKDIYDDFYLEPRKWFFDENNKLRKNPYR